MAPVLLIYNASTTSVQGFQEICQRIKNWNYRYIKEASNSEYNRRGISSLGPPYKWKACPFHRDCRSNPGGYHLLRSYDRDGRSPLCYRRCRADQSPIARSLDRIHQTKWKVRLNLVLFGRHRSKPQSITAQSVQETTKKSVKQNQQNQIRTEVNSSLFT